MSLPLQDVLKGKYEILEKIGEGGIGAVYKVRHRLLEEVRVIKVLRPEAASREELRERFLHEARMAIRLKHPNIAQLHDFSIAEDGRAYIVMEYIDGVALDALIDASGPPSLDLALEIARQGLEALHYLHEHDFVHRDVSPDNMMLTSAFDGRPLVKLIDLGIARHLGAEARLTATGVFLGKARYCSPEQFSAGGENAVEVDRRGDIYSFGIMLYELLTGVYPMEGKNFAELAGAHLFHPPKAFSETDPEGRLPEGLREAVLTALAKAPEERFQTADEMSQALAAFADNKAELREEFDRTVEIATTAMPKMPGKKARAGSTQDRLNAQFGMGATQAPQGRTAPDSELRETVMRAKRRTLAGSVEEIQGLIARGKRRRARRALDRALADHGTAQPLIELREAVERLAEAGGERRRLPVAALAAGGVLLVAGGLGTWWWLGRGAAPAVPVAPSDPASALVLVPAPRFDPEAGGGEPAPFAAQVEEPPPFEPPPPAAGQAPPGPSAPGGAVSPEPDPGGGPAAAGEAASTPPPPPPPPEVTREIFKLGALGVVPPVLLELPPLEVPDDARKLSEPLTVVVKVLVDETGQVSRALISEGPSFRRKYRDAALEAAEKARFRPARRGNTIGRMWTDVRLTFRPE